MIMERRQSNTIKDRTKIHTKSGVTKAYVRRNPQLTKLTPLNQSINKKRASLPVNLSHSKTDAGKRPGLRNNQRSISELNWTSPGMRGTTHGDIGDAFKGFDFPKIELPSFDEDDGETNEEGFLSDVKHDFEEEDGRLQLLNYLKRGARPSITPMNSVDSESSDENNKCVNKESVKDTFTEIKVSSKSIGRMHSDNKQTHVPKRVSIGEDVNLQFTRGSRPPSNYTVTQWSTKRVQHFAYRSRVSVDKGTENVNKINKQTKRPAKKKSDLTDEEIIEMYRQGKLQPVSKIEDLKNMSSQYNIPLHKCVSTSEGSSDESPASTSLSPAGSYAAESGIASDTCAQATSESDSRKPSDPNCLQIPDITCHPVNVSGDSSESNTDGPPTFDSKSSTPALLEPHEIDSRPLSCSSSLADTSLMLETDDIASLPGSPYPGSKPHPGFRRRSSSIDSIISRPSSEFLEVPPSGTSYSRDRLPAGDSPRDSPVAPPSPINDTNRFSDEVIQHQVVHKVCEGSLPCTRASSPKPDSRKSSEGIIAPAVSLTTDDGDDFAVWFGRRGSIFIEERNQFPQQVPTMNTTTDETGQVSLAVPRQGNL